MATIWEGTLWGFGKVNYMFIQRRKLYITFNSLSPKCLAASEVKMHFKKHWLSDKVITQGNTILKSFVNMSPEAASLCLHQPWPNGLLFPCSPSDNAPQVPQEPPSHRHSSHKPPLPQSTLHLPEVCNAGTFKPEGISLHSSLTDFPSLDFFILPFMSIKPLYSHKMMKQRFPQTTY